MKRFRKRPLAVQPVAGINLVPLIDLALNLVLIMIIIAPAMNMVRLPVELPPARSADIDKYDSIRLDLAEDGRVSVDGEIIESWAALPQILKAKMQKLRRDKLLLEVDRRVPYRQTSKLLNIIRHHTPITDISIGTVPPK